MPRQPIYCTWEANSSKTHTPGSFRRGRVTSAAGWINSALGELARIEVDADDNPARSQHSAMMTIYPGAGTRVTQRTDGTIQISLVAESDAADPDAAGE